MYTGPLRSCVPPEPNATPAATVGLRKSEPRTEWLSRAGSAAAARCSTSWIPAPAQHTIRSPPSIGETAVSRLRLMTTDGRSSASRGTDAPVSPVFAPCGITQTSPSTHACRQSIASWIVPGRTTACATPRPSREPRCSTSRSTCAAPTIEASFGITVCCFSLSGAASQHARGYAGGSSRSFAASSLRRTA